MGGHKDKQSSEYSNVSGINNKLALVKVNDNIHLNKAYHDVCEFVCKILLFIPLE